MSAESNSFKNIPNDLLFVKKDFSDMFFMKQVHLHSVNMHIKTFRMYPVSIYSYPVSILPPEYNTSNILVMFCCSDTNIMLK